MLRVISGFALAALVAELILRALPVSTGYSFREVSAAQPVLRGAAYAPYVYSRNWNFRLPNRGRLNNYGFRASYDYEPDPAALLAVGNSYVAADALIPRESMTERLGRLLGRPAYALGVDGFALVDYLVAARWAAANFWPQALRGEDGDSAQRALIVLLTTEDLDHSCSPRKGEHYLKFEDGKVSIALVPRATPSRLKNWVNDSMLFRYLFDNLRLTSNWAQALTQGRPGQGAEPGGASASATAASRGCATPAFRTEATRYLLDGFRAFAAQNAARVVFVVAPAYRGEQGYAAWATRDIELFAGRAEAAGFEIVRMDAPFAAAVRAGLRLDFLPVDGHWNATANAIAAQTIAARLQAIAPLEKSETTANRQLP